MTASGAAHIRVVPSAITDAGGVTRSIATAVRRYAAGLPGVASASWVGADACADALVRAGRLLEQMVAANADGLDALSKALDLAGVTYRVADAQAVPSAAGASP